VKRLDTGAVVVAAGTPMIGVYGMGKYRYTFSAPSPGLHYSWVAEVIHNGSTYHFEQEYVDPSTPPLATPATAGWKVTGLPSYQPVTYAELARHLRQPGTYAMDEDDAVELIAAATDYAESAMSICLAARTIVATFAPGEPLILPRGPLISVLSITDANAVAAASFSLQHEGHQVTLIPQGSLTSPISVMYRAGFALPDGTENAEAIPAGIRHTIKMLAGTYYEARESTTDKARATVPHSVDDFFRRYSRSRGVG
jgi:uncharacterized phiE125 gp8 family phage protein